MEGKSYEDTVLALVEEHYLPNIPVSVFHNVTTWKPFTIQLHRALLKLQI